MILDNERECGMTLTPTDQAMSETEAGKNAQSSSTMYSDAAEDNGGGDFRVRKSNTPPHIPIPIVPGDSPSACLQAPSAITYEGIAALLDSKLKHVARAEDLNIVKADLTAARTDISEIAGRTSRNEEEIRHLKEALMDVERSRVQNNVEVQKNKPAISTPRPTYFRANAMNKEQESARVKKFELSRRSLRVWPIAGANPEEISTKLRDFLQGALLMTSSEINNAGIQWIERTRPTNRSDIYEEIKIIFDTKHARDSIAAKGRLLASYVDQAGKPRAGFRLDVPDYLGADFKVLYDYGNSMRRQHGKDTRRYIKYDDDDYSLFLELRLPGNPVWLRISPYLARELKEEADREDIANARSLLSRPVRRSAPDLRFNSNFSPINIRQSGTQAAESESERNDRITANLRAEGMKGLESSGPDVDTGPTTTSTPAPDPSPQQAGPSPMTARRRESGEKRQTWFPPPNKE